jgi:hypothetical protein
MKKLLIISFLIISTSGYSQNDSIKRMFMPFIGITGYGNNDVVNDKRYSNPAVIEIGTAVFNNNFRTNRRLINGFRYGSELAFNWPKGNFFIGPKVGYEVMSRSLYLARISVIDYTDFNKQTLVIAPEIGAYWLLDICAGWNFALTKDNFYISGFRVTCTLELPFYQKK